MLVIYLPNGSKLWDMLVMKHFKGFPLLCSFYWVYNLAILHCLSFHLLHVQNSCWHSNQFKCNIFRFLSLSFKFCCPCRWCHINTFKIFYLSKIEWITRWLFFHVKCPTFRLMYNISHHPKHQFPIFTLKTSWIRKSSIVLQWGNYSICIIATL